MRVLHYFFGLLLLSLFGCQLSEVHVNELAPDTFELVIEQQAESSILRISGAVKTPNGGISIIGTKAVDQCVAEKLAIGFQLQANEKGIIQGIRDLSFLFPIASCSENYVTPKDVVITANGDYAICGIANLNGNSHFYVDHGSNSYIKKEDTGQANALIATDDGGLIVVGWIIEEQQAKTIIIKFKADLTIEWEEIWEDQTPNDILDDQAGGLDIVAIHGDSLAVLLNALFGGSTNLGLYANTNLLNLFPAANAGNGSFGPVLLERLTNGLLIVSFGTGGPGFFNSFVLAYDEEGTKVWETPGYSMLINDLQPTPDGGFLIFGTTITANLGNAPSNALLIKIDANGQEVWQQAYGGNLDDEGHQVVLLDDGGYMLVGINRSISVEDEVNGNKGIYLIRTDENGAIN